MPSAPIDIGGPLDNTAVVASPALSGSLVVLEPLNGAMVPCTLDIQVGLQKAWSAGDPQFGITSSATSGYICTKFNVDVANSTYSAHFDLFPGSALPAWGTAAET